MLSKNPVFSVGFYAYLACQGKKCLQHKSFCLKYHNFPSSAPGDGQSPDRQTRSINIKIYAFLESFTLQGLCLIVKIKTLKK